ERGIHRRTVNVNVVSDQFFRTMDVPLLAGRDFDERDTLNSPPAAIVNERFAREVVGGSNPLGVTFYVARGKPEERIYQIVGLVVNTEYSDGRGRFRMIILLEGSDEARPSGDTTLVSRCGAVA